SETLRGQAVGVSVPTKEGVPRRPKQSGRISLPQVLPERHPTTVRERSLRDMATRTCESTLSAQARIEEQCTAQTHGERIIRMRIVGARRQRFDSREALQELQLVRLPWRRCGLTRSHN